MKFICFGILIWSFHSFACPVINGSFYREDLGSNSAQDEFKTKSGSEDKTVYEMGFKLSKSSARELKVFVTDGQFHEVLRVPSSYFIQARAWCGGDLLSIEMRHYSPDNQLLIQYIDEYASTERGFSLREKILFIRDSKRELTDKTYTYLGPPKSSAEYTDPKNCPVIVDGNYRRTDLAAESRGNDIQSSIDADGHFVFIRKESPTEVKRYVNDIAFHEVLRDDESIEESSTICDGGMLRILSRHCLIKTRKVTLEFREDITATDDGFTLHEYVTYPKDKTKFQRTFAYLKTGDPAPELIMPGIVH